MDKYLILSPEELHTRGGALDRMLNGFVDAAVVLDAQEQVLYVTPGFLNVTNQYHVNYIGQNIRKLPFNDFETYYDVLKNGLTKPAHIITINKKNYFFRIFPVKYSGEVIGVVYCMIFNDLSKMKLLIKDIETKYPDEFAADTIKDPLHSSRYCFDDFLGESPEIKAVIKLCKAVCYSEAPILLLGETGTGKEVLANAIYREYRKVKTAPFIGINCSAIPASLLESELFGYEKGAFTGATSQKMGKFQAAEGGVLFLDEIGDMDITLQGKLLRVLETKIYERVGGNKPLSTHARIIAATNQDLQALCRQGKFRVDLFFRLNTYLIRIPPLREHLSDIPVMIDFYRNTGDLSIQFTKQAMDRLLEHTWPGNVRELKNLLVRLDQLFPGETISFEVVDRTISSASLYISPENNTLEHNSSVSSISTDSSDHTSSSSAHAFSKFETIEKEAIENTLEQCQYNISKAARILGISRTAMYNKMKRYAIHITKGKQ